MNDPLENIQLNKVTDIESIRKLYKQLKNVIPGFTLQAMSEGLGYNRGYLPKVVNGHDPLTPEILKRINEKYVDGINNVPCGTNENKNSTGMSTEEDYKDKLLASKDETIKALNGQIEALKKGETNLSDVLKTLKGNTELLNFLVEKLIPVPTPPVAGVPSSANYILLSEKGAAIEKEDK